MHQLILNTIPIPTLTTLPLIKSKSETETRHYRHYRRRSELRKFLKNPCNPNSLFFSNPFIDSPYSPYQYRISRKDKYPISQPPQTDSHQRIPQTDSHQRIPQTD